MGRLIEFLVVLILLASFAWVLFQIIKEFKKKK